MIHFEWSWAILVLPLPLLVRKLLKPLEPEWQAALKVPFLNDFSGLADLPIIQSRKGLFWWATIAWLLLILATMRPQWLDKPIEYAVSGRDLMLAIDLSGSMEEKDFRLNNQWVDRLTATKQIASQFIQRRVGDRLGLILFGTQAYLQVPLTFDRTTVITLLNESVLGLAGKNTAIGDAIGLAVKRLQQHPSQRQVLILLTDGANTAGEISPIKAAELAAKHQLKIYTIGIGADEMIVQSFFGSRKINPSVDLDEKTLKAIAKQTGGRYFRARNTEEFNQIYQLLDKLEPVERDKQYFRPRTELFYLPLGIALLIAGIICFIRLRGQN